MSENRIQVWDKTWSNKENIAFDLMTRIIFQSITNELSLDGKTVLELGCGSGRLSYLAYKAGAKELTLVDFSDEALRIARNLFKGINKVNFIKSDLLKLNPAKKCDIVFSSGVIEHFKEEELPLAIEAHARYSKEYVAIVVPSNTVFNKRLSVSPQNIQRYGYEKPISVREMERLFKGANINRKRIRRFHSMYGVPLPPIPGIGYVRTTLTTLLKPLGRWIGGLLIAIGEV